MSTKWEAGTAGRPRTAWPRPPTGSPGPCRREAPRSPRGCPAELPTGRRPRACACGRSLLPWSPELREGRASRTSPGLRGASCTSHESLAPSRSRAAVEPGEPRQDGRDGKSSSKKARRLRPDHEAFRGFSWYPSAGEVKADAFGPDDGGGPVRAAVAGGSTLEALRRPFHVEGFGDLQIGLYRRARVVGEEGRPRRGPGVQNVRQRADAGLG
eukprot:scaffold1090_cov265-Pinguiococcus_pyrenoidosus.AAC.35